MIDEPDLMNAQGVGALGEDIVVMMPRAIMTKDEALVHAAWLVAMADMRDDRFPGILDAVRNT